MTTRKRTVLLAGFAISWAVVSSNSFPSTSLFCSKSLAQESKQLTASKYPATEHRDAAAMAERLGKGIVVDYAPPQGGSPVKVIYDAAQLDAVKAAGFQSIRIYVTAASDPAIYKPIIDDALERGLATVISMWGNPEWESRQQEGVQEFVQVWDGYANCFRDYPEELVFDLWNEPSGLTVKGGKFYGVKDGPMVMEYLNAVIPVIRESNPNRTLGIGGPGLNGTRELKEFVTPEYLTYKLEDGTGFEDDQHLIGFFHLYHPQQFAQWTQRLKYLPGWQEEIREELSHPAAWSKKWNKPVMLSEWGAWAPPSRSADDFRTYLQFLVDECRKNDIEWIYYALGYNNQWGFSLLHTEFGWDQDALDVLTGVSKPAVPPISQLINTEFGWTTSNWNSSGSASISVARSDLSGSTALKVQATTSADATVYQESMKGKGLPPKRYLIGLKKGNLYKLTFLAKRIDGDGIIRARFSDASQSAAEIWTSQRVQLSATGKEYTVEYRHDSEDLHDVRVAFLFGECDQTVLLDRVTLCGTASGSLPNAEPLRKSDENLIAHFESKKSLATNSTTHKAEVNLVGDVPEGAGKLAAKTVVDDGANAAGHFGTGFGSQPRDCSAAKQFQFWIKTDIASDFNFQIHSTGRRASVFQFSTTASESGAWKRITAPLDSFTVPQWAESKADLAAIIKWQVTAFGSGPYDGKFIILDHVAFVQEIGQSAAAPKPGPPVVSEADKNAGPVQRGGPVMLENTVSKSTAKLPPEGFRPLFDGKTFDGWQAHARIPVPRYPGAHFRWELKGDALKEAKKNTGRWTIEDGAIVGGQEPPGGGKGAYLVSKETFGDFELIMDMKPDWKTDSGFLIRTLPSGSPGMQILVDHRPQGGIGGFYGNGLAGIHGMPFAIDARYDAAGNPVALIAANPNGSQVELSRKTREILEYAANVDDFLKVWKFGDWNTVKVRCEGRIPKITSWVNGLKIAVLEMDGLEWENYDAEACAQLQGGKGHISLEVHDTPSNHWLGKDRWWPGAVVRWKNIFVRELE